MIRIEYLMKQVWVGFAVENRDLIFFTAERLVLRIFDSQKKCHLAGSGANRASPAHFIVPCVSSEFSICELTFSVAVGRNNGAEVQREDRGSN
jgi:hypothetical protein